MILSQTAVYALKAVLHLAEQAAHAPLRVDDITKAVGVPRNYLSKVLHALAREGILVSARGPKGGFQLAGRADELFLGEVIAQFDDIAAGSGCLLGRERCSDESPCAAHQRWRDVSNAVRQFLDQTTIADLTHSGARLELEHLGVD
ncbi:MAG: Rrf2 family transcriptional regulator [Gemmatimonadota bacterium]|nr:Rrf2 family transcriptional regulator [Gemmatimonadota bacterium]MDH5758550.1 Rrf2 family transcriptional regulator [Gemmatimonadota bacterium]